MANIIKKISSNHFVLPVFFFFLFALYLSLFIISPGDMGFHAYIARQMLAGEMPTSGNFLFYWMVNIFSFFSTNKTASKISLCFLLAVATTLRYHWSQRRLNSLQIGKDAIRNFLISTFFAVTLIVVFVIPFPTYITIKSFYIGNFVPNIWHNSTTIFLFPFALFLFSLSIDQITNYKRLRNIYILILIFINILIKPSFFFAYILVYPPFLLYRYKFSQKFWLSISPVFLGGLLLLSQYYLIYHTTASYLSYIYSTVDNGAVTIRPFFVYTIYGRLQDLPFSILFSILFPFTFSVLNFSRLKKETVFWFIIALVITSILIYLLLSETGMRAAHGNFYWQVVICVWLYYFYSLQSLLRNFREEGMTLKNKFLGSLYGLHVSFGLIYIVRMFAVKIYF
ncbi:MAG: hypothetical protein LBH80_00130 [Prevotellaceae bacterium]|jgi:hypothetical protein|nr:hypothetical protein [Prevotellaceae bacterium]